MLLFSGLNLQKKMFSIIIETLKKMLLNFSVKIIIFCFICQIIT